MKYKSIKIGQTASLKHKITESDINTFVQLTGDDNKLHLDKTFAKQTDIKTPVAHGMIGASFISTIIGTKLPGDGALWYSQNLEYLLPVRVGDTINVKCKVLKKIDRNQSLELETNVFNQHNQQVISGTSKVKVLDMRKAQPVKSKKTTINKVALVVGSTGGIGFASSLRLAEDGFDIIAHYNSNENKAKKLLKRINKIGKKCIIVKSDLRSLESVKEMFMTINRNLNRIDIVVNAVTSGVPNVKFENSEWKLYKNHFNINIKGFFNLTKCVLPIMESQNFGKIINITTQYVEDPKPELSHYISAKAGLSGFTKALAVELAPKGIRLNLVSPGMTDTDLIADVPEKVKLLAAAQTPLRKLAKPEDIAGAISFLSSESSNFITGETIRVNGGQIMI